MKECPLCLEAFNATTHCPRILPCGHTYCTPCLARVESGGAVTCPVDRQRAAVAGVDALPRNLAVLDGLAAAPALDAPACDGCGGERHATHYCIECEDHYCETIATAHVRMKLSRGHTVVALADKPKDTQPPSTAPLPATVKCKEHSTADLSLFDTECNVPVCVVCLSLGHHGHKCKSLGEAAEECKAALGRVGASLAARAAELRAAEACAVEESKALEASVRECERDIRETFQEVGEWEG